MQNRKWILTSLVMTFFGIPILAQFLAAVIAMLGVGLAGIIEEAQIHNIHLHRWSHNLRNLQELNPQSEIAISLIVKLYVS